MTYECECALGYEGKNCEQQIDYCMLNKPCLNGGTCSNIRQTRREKQLLYKCECAAGWRGVNCTQDIDECSLMRSQSITACSGNGECQNTRGSFRCDCEEFHYGKLDKTKAILTALISKVIS